ncbi:MAG: YciI family protein [Thermoleophilaceae bacterium]|nr:YciI family protein [Thermoleophilaceae bacterium]
MRYMLVIVGDESRYADWSKEEMAAQMQLWSDYSKALVDAGAFVSGEGLQSSTTATTLRVQDGERLLTDGPFVETKEQIGGFYVIECKDLDEAIDWAAQLPSARRGGVCEIRPVLAYEGYEDPQTAREGAAS